MILLYQILCVLEPTHEFEVFATRCISIPCQKHTFLYVISPGTSWYHLLYSITHVTYHLIGSNTGYAMVGELVLNVFLMLSAGHCPWWVSLYALP